jgi:hypothetical protein
VLLGSPLPFPVVYIALRAGHSTTTRAVTLGSYKDVIAIQDWLVGIGLLHRLRSPMPELDHVLGLYPETTGRSSRERFGF